ncbi:hypothetical protein CHARACLAT_026730, partial [Characodon lateralis]|nr:hypothetical protein [Characodon lateralis]
KDGTRGRWAAAGIPGYFWMYSEAETCFYVTLYQAVANELKYQNVSEGRQRVGIMWSHICGSLNRQQLLIPALIIALDNGESAQSNQIYFTEQQKGSGSEGIIRKDLVEHQAD